MRRGGVKVIMGGLYSLFCICAYTSLRVWAWGGAFFEGFGGFREGCKDFGV